MKAIQCEKCGSIELTKSGNVYTCEACGTTYDASVSDLRKVSLDHSDEIQRLFKAARRAKELGNYDGAQGYYDEILGKNPDSWEAVFNTVYLRFMQGKVGEVSLHANQMAKVLPTVIGLVHDDYSPDEQDAALGEIEESIEELNILFESGSEYLSNVKKNSANLTMATGSITGLLTGAAAKLDAASEFASSRSLSAMMLSAFGDSVEAQFGEEIKKDGRKTIKDVMLRSWKGAAAVYASIDNRAAEWKVADCIRRWEPGFQTSSEKVAEGLAKREKEKREKSAQKKRARDEALRRNKGTITKALVIVAVIAVIAVVAALVFTNIVMPGMESDSQRANVEALLESGNGDGAIKAYWKIKDPAAAEAVEGEIADKAGQYMSSGEYDKAIVLYNGLGDTESANEAKYQLCVSKLDGGDALDEAEFHYLKTLKNADYKDSAERYDATYSWKTSVAFNQSKDDWVTDQDTYTISSGQTGYFHVSIEQGPFRGKLGVVVAAADANNPYSRNYYADMAYNADGSVGGTKTDIDFVLASPTTGFQFNVSLIDYDANEVLETRLITCAG